MQSAQRATISLNVSSAVSGPPVDWARQILGERLAQSGVTISDDAGADGLTITVSPLESDSENSGEAFAFAAGDSGLEIQAGSAVGASYALINLADQVQLDGSVEAAFASLNGTQASPAAPVRGIMRSFSSVDEDLPWFHDRDFWTEYLDWMAQSRFNRFHLALGMQYNYGADRHGATDNYLCFAYPFFFAVDGWDVQAQGVSDAERDKNLEILKFVAAETKRRGMSFQMGLWNHAYDYGRDSQHRFEITGLTPETHADYSAAAITKLITEVPEIDGFSFRVHYEGGIHDEGHEIFWGKVFDACSAAAPERGLEIDMHAKGVDQALLDAVNRPGLRPVLGAKYWAEHQGLPYHQASIRKREEAKPIPPGKEMTAITEFSRRFTRYGYGDFLNEDRQADMIFRIWPGTQKVLLWGDPAQAAGYGRLTTFAGTRGIDICEPTFFKGRKGSGAPGQRDLYVDPELQLGLRDWTKYKYTYLVWGRRLFNPDAPATEEQAYLRETYGDNADAVQRALANLSRILPLVTVVHGVGGSNNGYWPEVCTNLPTTDGVDPGHYRDTDNPPQWGTVSPFDPTTFYIINEYAADLAAGQLNGKYTPIEVAEWLEGFTQAAEEDLATLRVAAGDAQLRRTLVDLEVQHCLGRYFAAKFRGSAEYAVYKQSGNTAALQTAVEQLRAARDAYADILPVVEGVYQSDMMFGPEINEHGHWADRLPAVEADLAAMEAELAGAGAGAGEAVSHPVRPSSAGVRHSQPENYDRGAALVLAVEADAAVAGVTLNYRHVNQAESFQSIPMEGGTDGTFRGEIPADYTSSTYPLMYFFTVDHGSAGMTREPLFDTELANQPYYFLGSKQGHQA